MQENFTIAVPNFKVVGQYYKFFISLIISLLIIVPIFRKDGLNLSSISCTIVLTLIIFVIITSISNENLYNETPSYLYPSLPHTGLDGISLNNYVSGLDLEKYY